MPQTQSVVWPDDLYNRIKQREKADGVKFSDVVRNAVELYLGLDPEMVKIAIKYGAALDCDPITVIQNLAIGKIAEWDAQKEFFGPTDRLLDEFVRLDGKTVADSMRSPLMRLAARFYGWIVRQRVRVGFYRFMPEVALIKWVLENSK